MKIFIILILQGIKKVNTALLGRKNGYKIPIFRNPTEGIIEAGKELHEEYS